MKHNKLHRPNFTSIFFKDLNHISNDFLNLNNYQAKDNYLTVPRANVVEDENGFSIELAAPGFTRDEFELNLHNNTLTVSVNTEDTPEYEKSVTMREYKFQNFSRSWNLPDNTNIEGIVARYEAGILYIDVPVESRRRGKKTIAVQ
jgi:HSP20 family protein